MKKGYFGKYGGAFMPEVLVPAIGEVERTFLKFSNDPRFLKEMNDYLKDFVGRPSPLYFAEKLSKKLGVNVYLKREDLCHTGSHKLNNCLGQCLLAKYMGKKRVIAETGAGQHGVATAAACALLGMECAVYMGSVDVERQSVNVFRMQLLGTKVMPVESGSRTLKDAINEALRDWITNVETTFYCIGSVIGPHPYPAMVKQFQRIIGKETKEQAKEMNFKIDAMVACVGGGSNSMGLFADFVNDRDVEMYGVEAGGTGEKHAATLSKGRPGVLHGTLSYLLQDENGQVSEDVHSISAGLDYPGVGPEHSHFKDSSRVTYDNVLDSQAVEAFLLLSGLEGIMPALESAHAIAYVIAKKEKFKGKNVVICLSGRGDKDIGIVTDYLKGHTRSKV